MLNEPTVLAVTAIALKEALEARGLDPVALAERAGLDLELMAQPGARYRSAKMQAFWRLAAQETDDPLLGLSVGEYYRPTMLHDPNPRDRSNARSTIRWRILHLHRRCHPSKLNRSGLRFPI